MSNNQNEPSVKLERLCNALADEIDAMSDEVLQAELKETGEDGDAIANQAKALIANAIARVGRRKREAARAAYEAHQLTDRHDIRQWPMEHKRNLIQRFAQKNDELEQKLTLAARKGQDTEGDIDSLIEDLIELGLIDDEGNTT